MVAVFVTCFQRISLKRTDWSSSKLFGCSSGCYLHRHLRSVDLDADVGWEESAPIFEQLPCP